MRSTHSTRKLTHLDRLLALAACMLVLLAAAPGALAHAGAARIMRPGFADGNLAAFVHIANAANSAWDYTLLDNPNTNGAPNAVLLVTQNWNSLHGGQVFNNHNIGAWYTGAQWAIFNEDGTAIPSGAQFNVVVHPAVPGGNMYAHTATAANTFGDFTVLDNPLLNGNPAALALVTPVYGAAGVYNNHPTGVWYTGSHWAVYNEDGAAMPTGVVFHVEIGPLPNAWVPNGDFYVHSSTAANTMWDYTVLSNGFADGTPGALVFETHNWGAAGSYLNHPTGVWYTGTHWAIFNEDSASMPTGLNFNVEVITI